MRTSLTSTQLRAARLAGAGYLAIIILGLTAELGIRANLVFLDDASRTASEIAGAQTLFRLSIAGDLVMLGFDAAVGAALFVVFRPAGAGLTVISTIFRVLHTAVYGATLVVLTIAAHIVSADANLAGFTAQQADTFVLLLMEAQASGYALGLAFFGVHVALLGLLILRSGYMPKTIGWLLLLAAVGYLADTFARVLLTNYADVQDVFSIIVLAPAFVGELSVGLWLLLKGVRDSTSAAETARLNPTAA